METFYSYYLYPEQHAWKFGGLIIVIMPKSQNHFPSPRTGWQGAAAVFISVGAARAATRCRICGPELSAFLL